VLLASFGEGARVAPASLPGVVLVGSPAFGTSPVASRPRLNSLVGIMEGDCRPEGDR